MTKLIHYVYGSGSRGCLYDNGPCFADTREDAIEGALFIFGDLPENELAMARVNLHEHSLHEFTDPSEAGAQYVEISEEQGANPEWEPNDIADRLDAIYEAHPDKGLSFGPRKVHVGHSSHYCGNGRCTIFAFGSFDPTYVAAFGRSFDDCLEEAACVLRQVAPGSFVEPEYPEDFVAMQSEDADRAQADAEADLTYTEAGWLISHEWFCVAEDISVDELFDFVTRED